MTVLIINNKPSPTENVDVRYDSWRGFLWYYGISRVMTIDAANEIVCSGMAVLLIIMKMSVNKTISSVPTDYHAINYKLLSR